MPTPTDSHSDKDGTRPSQSSMGKRDGKVAGAKHQARGAEAQTYTVCKKGQTPKVRLRRRPEKALFGYPESLVNQGNRPQLQNLYAAGRFRSACTYNFSATIAE